MASGTAPPSSSVESDSLSTHEPEVVLALPHPLPKTPTHKTVANTQATTSTPFALKPSGMVSGDHDRDAIYPLLRHDLRNHTKTISVDKWVESILGVSTDTISEWSNLFSTSKVLLDTTVVSNMKQYKRQTHEIERYRPWSNIVNYIVKTAPTILPSLDPYPLPNLLFVQNHPSQIRGPGPYHARRSPDVVITLKDVVCKLLDESVDTHDIDNIISRHDKATKDIPWDQVIGCVEFKPGNAKLASIEWEKTLASPVGVPDVQANNPSPSFPGDDPFHNFPVLPAQPPRMSTGSSGSRKRKPEGVAENVPTGKRSKTGTLDVAPDVPLKDTPSGGIEQMASYALELLTSSCGIRSHCLQTLVDGPDLQLWYYDAGGMICSERMCWMTDFNKFAAIIVAFAYLDLAGWGIGDIPNLTPPTSPPAGVHLPVSLKGYTTRMVHRTEAGEREVEMLLGQEVFTQYSLVGRRTTVYDVTITGSDVPPELKKPLILKMSMQASRRTPEHELLNIARDAKVEHLPELYMWTDEETEWRLSDGIRGKVFPDNANDKEYEDRCQRLVVFKKYQAIEDAIVPANFHSIFAQVIECIRDLRYKANMLHRDISLSNLMYEHRNGAIWLILNDFDLATRVDGDGCPFKDNSSQHRTGTLPFMAVDILQHLTSSVHYIRHDLESVFWVAFWCLVKLPRSKDTKTEEARRQAIVNWEEGNLNQITNAKLAIITKVVTFQKILLTPEMLDYKEWILRFQYMLHDGYQAIEREERVNASRIAAAEYRARRGKGNPQPDIQADYQGDETLGNVLTCEKIIDMLKSWEEEHSEEGLIPYYYKN